jgi:hypothetical protein
MMPRSALLLTVLLALAGPVSGQSVREIDASELRKIVNAGGTLSLKSVVASVAAATGAEPIEARAFELDGIYYRIVLKKPDGSLISIVMDAGTGKQVTANSAIGRELKKAASASNGTSAKGKSATASENGKSKAGGNGNSGGNGKGNAGGNGNSGGNGNGGSGNGNSGGNGGGNGGKG